MSHLQRPLALLAGVLFVFALAGLPASSEPEAVSTGLGEGDAAVPFEGKEFVNTDPLSLKGLRGRLVLLELFSTT